ncbi:hypothetical protein J437_LFUL012152 [Ladona fulva]|uniref:RNA polymerase II subunit B1 CTD phosphatase RPAP2 homolog n=1 Tax=Ladona fulva TaxID=123851 RepID=A0A8K0KBX4_LADFU|nr:hypothetical protein J437_LFUL012152 [Ladona fulva]
MSSKSPKSSNISRRERYVITAQKKQECNTKALRIVETLLEETVGEEWLLENVKYIAQSHLQDAIEERALAKLCGYPICSKLLGTLPRQQYHISTKTNKVYDITERKHFCSNYCYKAAQYLKVQLLTSPVWLREQETIPNFHLLPSYSPGEHLGEEIELRHAPIKREECEGHVSKDDQSGNLDTDKHASTEGQCQITRQEEDTRSNEEKDAETKENNQACDLDSVQSVEHFCVRLENDRISIKEEVNVASKTENFHSSISRDTVKLMNVNDKKNADSCSSNKDVNEKKSNNCPMACNEIAEKERKNSKTSHKSKKAAKKVSGPVNFVSRIEAALKAWFTLDSLLYIYGNEKAKELMKDKRECLKEYYKGVEQSLWEPATQAKYMALCRKLDLMEIEEELSQKSKSESNPLPEYEQLRKDAEMMALKVREFYGGKSTNAEDSKSVIASEVDNAIPLVELHAQNALRRRIVLDRLRHVLPDLLRTFGMTSRDISSELRCLVTTFSLGADNIMFKPAEWNLIGLIILRM